MATVQILEGDTDQSPNGTGTFGSRSMAVGGSALDRAAVKIIEKGKRIAAYLLEVGPEDVEFAAGEFSLAGTERVVTRASRLPAEQLSGGGIGLAGTSRLRPANFAWSNGMHACELEVDYDTRRVNILGYRAVDDIGTVVNPMIVEGQIMDGIAQGLGQALREHCVYAD